MAFSLQDIKNLIVDIKVLFAPIIGYITYFFGKKWYLKLANWIKLKFNNWSDSRLRTIVIMVFDKYSYRIEKMSRQALIDLDMDRVIVARFVNRNIFQRFVDYFKADHFEVYKEIVRKGLVSLNPVGSIIPMTIMADHMEILKKRARIYVFSTNDNRENIPKSILDMMVELQSKSSYTVLVFDSEGKPIGTVSINSNIEERIFTEAEIFDFEKTGRRIGECLELK